MRSPLLAAIAGLILVASTARPGEIDQPIPQDLQKMRWARFEAFTWCKRTLADPFEKIGKKDPRWNESARKAVDLATRYFSRQIDPAITDEEVFKAAKTAIDAGCDDPILLYIYAMVSTGRNQPDTQELDRRYTSAAIALESSKYPPIRRALMLTYSGRIKTYTTSPELRKEALRMFDAALALLPESLETDGLSPTTRRLWRNVIGLMVECLSTNMMMGDRKSAFDKVDAAMAKVPAAKPIALLVRGNFYIDYAWDARGAGSGSTVTEDGWRKFGERAEEARKALQEAWDLDPTDSEAATRMLTVELAIGHGNRDEMETWFLRAMDEDGNNLAACTTKLYWLEPKWHGSAEEMLIFGRECRETKNWQSGIAFLTAEAHRRIAAYFPADQQVKYYQKPEVWEEIQSLYLEYLKEFPDDATVRSDYAGYCYLCSQYDEANAQFQKLGENLKVGRLFTEKWLKETRYATTERVRGDQKPNTPPAKGFAVLYATYGAREAWADVIKQARENIAGDRLKFPATLMPDPLFGVPKAFVVAYALDGKVGLTITPESPEYLFPPQEAGRMSDVPAQGFAVLDARFGDGDKWVDVTDEFRKRTANNKLETTAADLPDPAFGTHKAIVVLYAWEGRVYLSITRDDLRINLPAVLGPGGQ